jgi:predicted nucleic acid-binding protein
VNRFLLDVNVLIALIDPAHIQHDRAHAWFAKFGKKAWATCPLTENGVLRIVGHARYPNSPGTPCGGR